MEGINFRPTVVWPICYGTETVCDKYWNGAGDPDAVINVDDSGTVHKAGADEVRSRHLLAIA